MGAVKDEAAAGRDEALLRVLVYLQCLGLSPRQAVAKADELSKAYAMEPWGAAAPPTRVLERVIADAETWIAKLAVQAGSAGASEGMLVWHLREVLPEVDGGLMHAASASPAIVEAARRAAVPATPAETFSPMPTQPLGELPAFMRARFWQDFGQWVKSLANALLHPRGH